MAEGLSAAEVGKEIAEHREHTEHAEHAEHAEAEHAAAQHVKRDRWVSIAEAVMLSIVALIAAWSALFQLSLKRMRPGYRPAVNAWLATHPLKTANAPPDPSYMPQYVIRRRLSPRR